MVDLPALLTERLAPAFGAVTGDRGTDPLVRRSDRADYQADAALGLARPLRQSPRDIATAALAAADLTGLVDAAEVAGPGFVNLTVSAAALGRLLGEMAADTRVGVPVAATPQTVVIDYSAPNIGKELHVGHLRSTIIGDALARLLEFLGHRVIRQNHLGDWGATFGMLIEHYVDVGGDATGRGFDVGDLNAFYRQARAKFDGDPEFTDRARHRVVLLQAGDAGTLALWRAFLTESGRHFQAVYDALGVSLTPADNAGESTYNAGLPGVVDELDAAGLLTESEGALCVFPKGFTGREGKPLPVIVRKSDGGYGYEATDLVAIRHRLLDLHADRVLYVVGAEQHLRLTMIFAVAREAGWLVPPAVAEHVGFGLVLGADRRRLRTRSGEPPRLVELVDQAVARAAAVVAEKNPDLDGVERAAVAHAVGVGAIKYADLSGDRVKDYVFDVDQMVSFDGNTAPYLQYAHARVHSVFRRGGVDAAAVRGAPIRLSEPAEKTLALRLLEYDGLLYRCAETLEPHTLCQHLFEVATTFTTFYEHCPVLKAGDPATRDSRLALCDLTGRVLRQGLDLLGIGAPDRM